MPASCRDQRLRAPALSGPALSRHPARAVAGLSGGAESSRRAAGSLEPWSACYTPRPPTMNRDLIDRVLIRERLDADSKETALSEILAVLSEHSVVDEASLAGLRKLIDERESRGSTGIGNGFAVPHVKVDAVSRPEVVLARSVDGLEYGAIDGRPVHMLFLIVSPTDQQEEHLAVLRWVSGLARQSDFRRFALAADSADALRDLLVEMTEGPEGGA